MHINGSQGQGEEAVLSYATPVALFVFNRPATTRRVLEAVRAVRPRTLLVVADGPRDEDPTDAALVAETRALFRTIDWDCDLRTNFSERNLGLRARFASGFEWIFGQVDEAVMLEDDCLPHPSFFPYCEELLDRHRQNERVMFIGGTNPDRHIYGDGSYFFARSMWVWGWATWKRAWQHFDIGVGTWPEFEASRTIDRISPYKRLRRGYSTIFKRAYAGDWPNWDVQATYTVWSRDGVCVVPNGNLVRNIGFGAEATNTKSGPDDLVHLEFRPLDRIDHPSDETIRVDYDIKTYDTYASWMNHEAKVAAVEKAHLMPLYKAGSRTLRLLRRLVTRR